MGLVVEILEGIQKGEVFKITDKMTFGRKKSDVIIRDPNVSTLHASVSIDEGGIPILVDQNSRNGLIINDAVVRKIALYPGTKFTIGNTDFEAKVISDAELEELFPTKTWRDLLANEISQNALNTTPPQELAAFNPKVELHFIQGIQTDEAKILTYGPRTAGFWSFDIPLHDHQAPELAFKIVPSPEGARIVNFDLSRVLLNDAVFESSLLISGDRIKIGESIIKVLFLE
ncbi:MAG: FHA domain-containing protein [Bdellovibrionaceae bacterium]|nr:FHA domain-containing protein [Pseudobdellovibrionaceae bacterium]